jgi:hypothetical protein
LNTIEIKINKYSSDGYGGFSCCANNGCNWNYTTTSKNLSYDEIIVSVSFGQGNFYDHVLKSHAPKTKDKKEYQC